MDVVIPGTDFMCPGAAPGQVWLCVKRAEFLTLCDPAAAESITACSKQDILAIQRTLEISGVYFFVVGQCSDHVFLLKCILIKKWYWLKQLPENKLCNLADILTVFTVLQNKRLGAATYRNLQTRGKSKTNQGRIQWKQQSAPWAMWKGWTGIRHWCSVVVHSNSALELFLFHRVGCKSLHLTSFT